MWLFQYHIKVVIALPSCRSDPVCHQCRPQLFEADGGQAGAGGGVEVQAQRWISDCQRKGGPSALLPDRKTYMTSTHVFTGLRRVTVRIEITLIAKKKTCTNIRSEWTIQCFGQGNEENIFSKCICCVVLLTHDYPMSLQEMFSKHSGYLRKLFLLLIWFCWS